MGFGTNSSCSFLELLIPSYSFSESDQLKLTSLSYEGAEEAVSPREEDER